MALKKYEVHPLAAILPEMLPEEFEELKTRIKAEGIKQAIILHQGKILDGRHRYRAAVDLGLGRVPTDQYLGERPAAYVFDMNVQRRNLTPAQRAAVSIQLRGEMTQELGLSGLKRSKKGSGKASAAIAKTGNVSTKTVERIQRAKTVAKKLKDSGKDEEAKKVEKATEVSARAAEKAAVEGEKILKKDEKPKAAKRTDQGERDVRRIIHICGKEITPIANALTPRDAMEWADCSDAVVQQIGTLLLREGEAAQYRDIHKILTTEVSAATTIATLRRISVASKGTKTKWNVSGGWISVEFKE
jgi:hypothetical protein